MQLLGKALPRRHKLFLAGDMHFGSSLCNVERIQEMISHIQCEKDNYLILMGDQIDAIAFNDPRYDNTNPYNPIEQANMFVDMFSPIKDRIITALDGNHELKLRPFGLVTRDIICRGLGIDYGTSSCVVSLFDETGNFQYRVFCHHGFGLMNPSSPSYLARDTRVKESIKRKLMEKVGDCVVMAMGHVHKLVVFEPQPRLFIRSGEGRLKSSYVTPDPGSGFIHPDFRWYVGTGSFLKQYGIGYSGYSEIAGYDPVDLGYVVLNCWDGRVQEVIKVIV